MDSPNIASSPTIVKIDPRLQYGSTLKLVIFTIITLGIYPAHYIKKQTAVINEHCDQNNRISQVLVNFILIICYLEALVFVYAPVSGDEELQKLMENPASLGGFLILIWAFKARNRMNKILSAEKGQNVWFDGFATFLFSFLYFNFKINKLGKT